MLNLLGAVQSTFEKHQVNYEASSAFRSIDTCQMHLKMITDVDVFLLIPSYGNLLDPNFKSNE